MNFFNDNNIEYPISPLDGRYKDDVCSLRGYCSEFGLMRYRIVIEVEYFIELVNIPLPQLSSIDGVNISKLREIVKNFNEEDFNRIKKIEREIKHDVKAVEYFLQYKFRKIGLEKYISFIHFGLTSQDINCPANMIMLYDVIRFTIKKEICNISRKVSEISNKNIDNVMLGHTHGQVASPTTFGKELFVFYYRLQNELNNLEKIEYTTKFGGAVGNFNAHKVAYPSIDWNIFANNFIKRIGLKRHKYTTQISNYEEYSCIFDCIKRINCILIDLCVDIWLYISKGYLLQKISLNDVGSSTMPHKINPINFENAEGNLILSNGLLECMSRKLPISRMQRDLTDSTILRNIGVVFGYSLLAYKSILKGLNKIEVNKVKMRLDLGDNLEVLGEAIQTILRRENIENSYEMLKNLTRNNSSLTGEKLLKFINDLKIGEGVKDELRNITVNNYVGYAKDDLHLVFSLEC